MKRAVEDAVRQSGEGDPERLGRALSEEEREDEDPVDVVNGEEDARGVQQNRGEAVLGVVVGERQEGGRLLDDPGADRGERDLAALSRGGGGVAAVGALDEERGEHDGDADDEVAVRDERAQDVVGDVAADGGREVRRGVGDEPVGADDGRDGEADEADGPEELGTGFF